MPYTLHLTYSLYVLSISHVVFELFQSEDEEELPDGGASFGWFNDMFVYDTGMFLLNYNQTYIRSNNTNVCQIEYQAPVVYCLISGHF